MLININNDFEFFGNNIVFYWVIPEKFQTGVLKTWSFPGN